MAQHYLKGDENLKQHLVEVMQKVLPEGMQVTYVNVLMCLVPKTGSYIQLGYGIRKGDGPAQDRIAIDARSKLDLSNIELLAVQQANLFVFEATGSWPVIE